MEKEEPTTEEEEIDMKEGIKNFTAFFRRNYYQIVAIGMLIMALSGMWFCYKLGFTTGAVTICGNSGGTPLLKNSNNIKDGQCLIKYDSLGGFNNNLGLSDEQVMRFEESINFN